MHKDFHRNDLNITNPQHDDSCLMRSYENRKDYRYIFEIFETSFTDTGDDAEPRSADESFMCDVR